jgi:hypothetical protein
LGVEGFWSALRDRKQRQTQAAEVRKVLVVEKRRERLHGGLQGDPETSDPMGQVGNWILYPLFLIA